MITNEKINPKSAYYIKLGEGGLYEKECLEDTQTIRVGFNDIPHELCLEGSWENARKLFVRNRGYNPGTATRECNRLRTFYTAPENTLWMTFYKDCLYWCFAGQEITCLPDNSRTRPALGGWKSTNVNQETLVKSKLSGSLLSVQGFRGTLCEVKEFEYLIRKINAESSPTEKIAIEAREKLVDSLVAIIRSFDWKEFELLIDLIFRQAGWLRVSQLGKTQKTLDLDLLLPITNERCLVQVKSKAGEHAFRELQDRITGMQSYTRYYMVVHSPDVGLTRELNTDTEKIWFPADITELVVQYGLVDWVIAKAR